MKIVGAILLVWIGVKLLAPQVNNTPAQEARLEQESPL